MLPDEDKTGINNKETTRNYKSAINQDKIFHQQSTTPLGQLPRQHSDKAQHQNYPDYIKYPYYPNYPNYPSYKYYPYSPPKQPKSNLKYLISALIILPSYFFLGILLIMNLLSLIIGVKIVYPNLFDNSAIIALIYPWPNFVFIISISGNFLVFWYISMVVIIIISIIWLSYSEGKEFLKIWITSVKKMYPPQSKSKNSFILIAELFFIIWFFYLIVFLIMIIFGITPNLPVSGTEPATWEIFFALANASVAEEIFSRVIYIGLPLLVFDLIVRSQPNKFYKYLIGGGFKIEGITIILIIFSSLLFGLAHYPSWGLWKVLPTFVAGLAMGYLFVTKGIHTAIILHFLFDYTGLVLILFENNIGLLFFLSIILGIMILAWIGSGMIYFGVYLFKLIRSMGARVMANLNKTIPTAYPSTTNQNNDYHLRTSSKKIEQISQFSDISYDKDNFTNKQPIRPEKNMCPYCTSRLYLLKSTQYWYCRNCNRYIF